MQRRNNNGKGGGPKNGNRGGHAKKMNGGQLPQHAKSSLYKTELCRQFAISASCSYGSRCQFAHGEKDLRRRSCRHPKYKTQKCKAYWNQGFCPYGSRCMFLHDEKPEEVENITNRMSDMTVTQGCPPVPFDKKDGRTRSMSNRSLSHDSVEAKHWAQTVRGDTRTGSFGGGSTGSASSPIFIPNGGTTTNVPPRMYSFDLYESAGVATPDSESGDQTMKSTWPVIKSNTPTDGSVPAKTDGTPSTFSPAATEGSEEASGSRLSFFQRLRSKSIPEEEQQQQQQEEPSSGGKKSTPVETAASKTKKGGKKKKSSKK